MNKLKRIIFSIVLSILVATSSPLAALAQEANSAVEATQTQEAQTQEEQNNNPVPSPEPPVQVEQTVVEEQNPVDPQESAEAEEANEAEGIDEDDGDEQDEDDENESSTENSPEISVSSNDGNDQSNSGQIGEASIDTGDATTGAAIVNSANVSSISPTSLGSSCSVCTSGGDANISNNNNGSGSNNDATVNSDNSNNTQITNDANLGNNLNLNSVTGSNEASKNVGDSEIITGDANVYATVINSTNGTGLGLAEFNIIDNHNGDIILTLPDGAYLSTCGLCNPSDVNLQNTGNGADSQNNANANFNNTNTTTIDNDSDVINNLYLNANSGDNAADKNVGDSSIETGDANVAASLLNLLNTTLSGGVAFVVNIFGDLVGDIIFPDTVSESASAQSQPQTSLSNVANGTESNNSTTLNSTNNNTTNINNNAGIFNNLIVDASTGDNLTSSNTGGNNSIESGDIEVNTEVLNVANVTSVGDGGEPLWLILVNDMGTWTGKIIGSISGQNYAGNGFIFSTTPTGEITALNSENGAESTNNANINATNSNELNIKNNANLTNNLYIDANTGGNSASKNTGGNSEITTGDVNIAASIINFVNTVIIGRPLMVGIINVFGSWTGNAVPPGYEPEASQGAIGGTDQQVTLTNTSSSTNNSGSSSSQSSNSILSGQLSTSGQSQVSGPIAIFSNNTNNSEEENNQEGGSNQPLVFGESDDSNSTSARQLAMMATIPSLLGALLVLRKLKSRES